MEKKFEIIPLLPYRAGSINRAEEEKTADGNNVSDDKLQLRGSVNSSCSGTIYLRRCVVT